MPSFRAKYDDRQGLPLQVVFVVYPDIALLDLAGPLQAIAWARQRGTGRLAYETTIASLEGGSIPTDTLVSVETEPLENWARREIHTLVIVGGDGAYTAMKDKRLVDRVTDLANRSKRVCSVCSGALILAATGLLDGRRAVTHWEDCEALIDSFPDVRVEIDPIYIKDGDIWTSAGVTAGTDMALALVAEDLGQDAALERAQSLVTYMVRPGGQSQFSPALERQKLDRSARFERLHRWIAENLRKDLRVEALAERENMSKRSFHRLYSATMGLSPAKAVETIRLEAARDLLETTGIAVKAVADRCGFGDEERMRRTFARQIGVSPTEYRQRFRLGQSGQQTDLHPSHLDRHTAGEVRHMLFMVIEHFKDGDAKAVYRRFQAEGRQVPDGLTYLDSWVTAEFDRCFQLMECDDLTLLQDWVLAWQDLVDFEIHPVSPSKAAAAVIAPKL